MAQAWGNPFASQMGVSQVTSTPNLYCSQSPAPGTHTYGCWMGTSDAACPKVAPHPLANPRLPQDPTARDPGCPPLAQGLRTPRLLPLPWLTCHQALYQTHLQTALGCTAAQRPVAPTWVTARGPTSHPASSLLPGTACMGSRNGSSLHTPPVPLVAPHLPRDQPPAPRGPAWSLITPRLLSHQPGLRSSGPAPMNLRSQSTSARHPALRSPHFQVLVPSYRPPAAFVTSSEASLCLPRLSYSIPISALSHSVSHPQGRTFQKRSISICRILLSPPHAMPPPGPPPKETEPERK